MGLLLGMALAFGLEFLDTSIKTPADITGQVDLAILGTVPHTEDLEEEVEDVRTSVLDNSSSLMARAFRQIRTYLLFSAPVERRRSVLITSALPEDGRTTVTMNLAGSIVLSGHKVLVIDANLRQPTISRLFGNDDEKPRKQGLSNVLVGRMPWQDTIKEIRPNLHLMPSGPLTPNPGELLGSDRMREILAEMVEQYDQVLLDGPPALVVTDAAILSTVVDGVILVVRAGVNTHGIVQRTKSIFSCINAHILGAVLNGMRITAGGYLRKNYSTFYEYEEQGQLLNVDEEA